MQLETDDELSLIPVLHEVVKLSNGLKTKERKRSQLIVGYIVTFQAGIKCHPVLYFYVC